MTIRPTALTSTTTRTSRVLDRVQRRPTPRPTVRRRPAIEPLEVRTLLSAGALDESFDGDGLLTTTISDYDAALDVTVQQDGRVVAAGYAKGPDGTNDFTLMRYLPDGSLDPSFGDSGLVMTAIGRATPWVGSGDESVQDVAIQPDGRIVAAGGTVDRKGDQELALARYLPDGTLDASFGSGGIVTTDIRPDGEDKVTDLAIDAQGRIVVTANNFTLARYLPDGTLDSSFGSGGIVVTELGPIGEHVEALAIDPLGNLVVAGRISGPSYTYKMLVARFDESGVLDTDFGGGDGLVVVDLGPEGAEATGLAIQPDGRIVVAGTYGLNLSFAVVGLDTNGDFDTTFGGGDGVVMTAVGEGSSSSASDVVIRGDGRIVVSGRSYGQSGLDLFALAAYEADGSLDSTFGTGGIVTTEFVGKEAFAHAMAIAPDGDLVVAGGALTRVNGSPSLSDIAVARYVGEGITVSPAFGLETSESGGTAQINVVLNTEPSSPVTIQLATGDSSEGLLLDPSTNTQVAILSLTFDPTNWSTPQTVTIVGQDDSESDGDVSYSIIVGTASSTDTAYDGFDPADVGVVNHDDEPSDGGGGGKGGGKGGGPKNLTAASEAGPSSDADPLSRWQLRFALRSARAFWRDAGADLSRLGPLDIRIADLPGTTLGQADGSTITLDRDAAGHGWFLDPTPLDAADVPGDRMDLLTAVTHEIGHALGLEHDHDEDGHEEAIMAPILGLGTRRVPTVRVPEVASMRLR
ncbi:matrixin family metalloprotease [Tautonia marina]|uniref:matrixin family metalloprotease n=1 Tax=Tautonia marina TaxID=2653855 RepID=UPI0012611179|nr:matrixin family metalloprotease [Tautonia marina]